MIGNRVTTSSALSRRDILVITGLMILAGLLLLVALVFLAPRLLSADILNQFFYIVVVFWALIPALVLFGVLRSYSRLTYKHLGLGIELGGPAATAAIVVVGAFFLPRTDTFDITLRPHAQGHPKITSGRIAAEFGNSTQTRELNSDGEADFKGIAHKFWSTQIRVLPEVEGYKQQYQTIVIKSDAVDIYLEPEPPPQFTFKGRIVPAPKSTDARILIQDEPGFAKPDSYGRFEFVVQRKAGDDIRVQVCFAGREVYDQYIALQKQETQIRTRNPGVRCSRD